MITANYTKLNGYTSPFQRKNRIVYNNYMFPFVITLIAAILLVPWIWGFVSSNDLTVPDGSIRQYKKVLVVFPHPDDETLSAGGLISRLTQQKSDVTLIVLTRGEKGNPDAHIDPRLKDIRASELTAAAKALGVIHVTLEDFGDGELARKKPQLTTYITDVFRKHTPDLVITYDLSGLYGHEDHITVSEIVTDIIRKKYPKTTLLYTSFPKKIYRMIKLPEHMAKDPQFQKRRATPTMKVFVGFHVVRRIQAMYAYRSQLSSFSKGMPVPAIPLWWYYSLQLFEYYAKAN
jgi:LmbE family N-acetylglucosaminyl deacetylase